MNATKQINARLNKEDWPGARELIRAELRKDPHDHWLLTQLSTTYYEEKKYRHALTIVKKALAEMPTCPLVLWDYACTLDMLGQRRKAMAIYKKLLRTDVPESAYDECWEGKEWAASLRADCKYRIAQCYRDLGNKRQFSRYWNAYVADVHRGVDSIYKDKVLLVAEGRAS